MPSTINAQTTPFAAIVQTADDTGNLAFQTANVTAVTIDTSQNTSLANSLAFTATAARIRGDFTNATLSNRLMFQNSVSNGASNVQVLPNGTGSTAGFLAFANSDPTNTNFCAIQAIGSGIETRINSGITGTGTYAPITMLTGGSERLRIDTSGNVGIGTSSPAQKLDVQAADYVAIRALSTNSSIDTRLQSFSTGNYGYVGTISNHAFSVITNNTEQMRITSSGNVGIGTSSPSSRLHVAGGADSTIRNTASSGSSWFVGSNSSGYILHNESNTPMLFTTNGTERMRLSAAGGLSVGTTADPGAGAIFATGNITAYYSDDRLKTKLGGIENALDKVKSLSGFYYEANQTAQDLGYQAVREVGVSAQQVQAVLPEVVKPAPIDQQYLTVDYERLVPLLIEAIKELEEKVAKLENK